MMSILQENAPYDSPLESLMDPLDIFNDNECRRLADLHLADVVNVSDGSGYRKCGKRQSPSSISPICITSNTCDAELEQPKNKKPKPMLHNHRILDSSLLGFKEINLPVEFGSAMQAPPACDLMPNSSTTPVFRRCVSDSFPSPGEERNNSVVEGECQSLDCDGVFRRCVSDLYQSPGTVAKNSGSDRAAALPPVHPGWKRVITEMTPPKVTSGSLMGKIPDSLRLKRMKEAMKVMSQWVEDVIHDEDDEKQQMDNYIAAQQDPSDKDLEQEVSSEKVGDSLKIKLRCPCGSRYEIMMSGKSCYYKLLSI